jgi:RNA recognition motif-containing protein
VKLFVRNLAWSTTEADLARFLDEQGYVVREVKIAYDEDQRRSRGYGFVTFATPENYEQALRDLGGEEFMGRQLYVAAAIDKPRNGGSRGRRARREAGSGDNRDYTPVGRDDCGWEDL